MNCLERHPIKTNYFFYHRLIKFYAALSASKDTASWLTHPRHFLCKYLSVSRRKTTTSVFIIVTYLREFCGACLRTYTHYAFEMTGRNKSNYILEKQKQQRHHIKLTAQPHILSESHRCSTRQKSVPSTPTNEVLFRKRGLSRNLFS